MFKKKFKVKVSYWGHGKYTVSYAYYRFIPIWYTLKFWFEQTLTGGTECWSTSLMSVKEAEKLAQKIKNIDDVYKFYEKDELKESDFYKRKSEYYKNAVPYRSKIYK